MRSLILKTNELEKEKLIKGPRMKVFTVGLDQKPPMKDIESPPSPPPGYSSNTAIPIPNGPAVPPTLVARKQKSYKGVLVCMLAVFLIALFALTLSEIAYNRQRDENFFRLRWAELKHRMGYDYNDHVGPIFALRREKGLGEVDEPTTTTTVKPPTPMIDNSVEEKPVTINDRLQFFKKLLEGIKKHAEDMGFDGTMQVSVVQVDPFEQQDSKNVRSESNMDGFGEWHMPEQKQLPQMFGPWKFDDDFSNEIDNRFRNNWNQQPQFPMNFERFANNRIDMPFIPPQVFHQLQMQRFQPQQQGPFWWQQNQQFQNDFQQPPQQQRPQFIFFPDHNINQFQNQQLQLPEMNNFMFQHPKQNNFVAPEDRFQIEPPTPENMNGWKPIDNQGPRGWTHQEDAFVQAPPAPPQPAEPQPQVQMPLHFGQIAAIHPPQLPSNGVPEQPKKWENIQSMPALSIDPVSEQQLPSWTFGNSLEETPLSELGIDTSKEIQPPAIQPENLPESKTISSHIHILPIKELQSKEQRDQHDDQPVIEPIAPVVRDDTPIEPEIIHDSPKMNNKNDVDFPAVKFPIDDDTGKGREHLNPIFFQVDEPHPPQVEN